ncbi:ribulose-5-phosphate 4-epimerase-like epimerase or aldolase [Bradyrhizobium sp. YR681]|uniref:class II aldolase and adducin N-terminal domain-containing protein n=1 Tax=Bradyrhizobium sp. YR681 TaxID=1144344 RepID=UPI00027105E7|nr:class II aldolase and adducin N-terminal domain-containing protein [Bradyrhizobium sp. YR681]EJN11287.1 ribulose-5-phosphate 4-epimerase-like epimerase or aldolase [Bradyrhizobium sp. YR681]
MTNSAASPEEQQLRVDLAAAFRSIARLGMHEAVANHFSAAISADGRRFLMNPKWRHFSRVKASDLVLFDLDDEQGVEGRPDVDPTAWAIHGQMHRQLPQARVVMHLHPPFATTIASLVDPQIKPIDQNTARYFNRLAIDDRYGGMADSEQEGARLAALLGNKSRLMMGNHGVLVIANTVGEAFDDIYTLERACQILVQAYATGQPLKILPDAVAESTAQDWEQITDFSIAHFEEMKRLLDAEDPSYAH